MIKMSISDIAEITGGTLLPGVGGPALDPDTQVTGPVEFDSRKITPGAIFMALPGARVDGHDFIDQAIEAGAAISIVGREVGYPALLAEPVESNDDTANSAAFMSDPDGTGAAVIAAIDKLARHNTDVLVSENGMTVVGVTGSAGKTSTKDLIGALLRADGPTVAPPGSFNNEIGLPYTALRAGRDTKHLVSEMSARGIGHIRHLAGITPPTVGVVLNVGSAHLGEFGSREVIAQAKGELVEALGADGLAVLNADDDQVTAMRGRTEARAVFFSAKGQTGSTGVRADYWASNVRLDEIARPLFTLNHPHGDPLEIELGVFGAHQVSNALAAAAVAMECGIAPQQVADSLNNHVAASANRMDVRTRRSDGVTIINDSYNANPESMRAGVDALAYLANGRDDVRSWAVLGQMGELGEESTEEHRAIGELLGRRQIDHAVIVGNGVYQQALADSAAEHGVRTFQVEDTDGAANYLGTSLKAGDVVLVKASYSDGLWAVAELLLMGEN